MGKYDYEDKYVWPAPSSHQAVFFVGLPWKIFQWGWNHSKIPWWRPRQPAPVWRCLSYFCWVVGRPSLAPLQYWPRCAVWIDKKETILIKQVNLCGTTVSTNTLGRCELRGIYWQHQQYYQNLENLQPMLSIHLI